MLVGSRTALLTSSMTSQPASCFGRDDEDVDDDDYFENDASYDLYGTQDYIDTPAAAANGDDSRFRPGE